MIVDYQKWKKLNESTESRTVAFFSLDISQSSPFRPFTRENLLLFLESISDLFPESTLNDGELIIPQNKFENFEGEFEPFVLSVDSLLKDFRNIDISGNAFYPNAVMQWLKKNSTEFAEISRKEKGIRSTRNFVECSMKKEFIDYTKAQLIERISQDILSANCVTASDEERNEQIVQIMLLQSSRGILGDPNALLEQMLVDFLLCNSAQLTVDLLKESASYLQKIDLANLEKSVVDQFKSYLIDYSKLSEKETEEILEKFYEFSQYVSKQLPAFLSPNIKNLRSKVLIEMLQHLRKYPEALVKFKEISKKY